jgi:hypothetical protein
LMQKIYREMSAGVSPDRDVFTLSPKGDIPYIVLL